MKGKRILLPLFVLLLAGCSLPAPAKPTSPPPASFTPQPAASPSPTLQPPSLTPPPTATFTPAPSQTPSPTPTASPIPTYAILRGKVNVEKVSCRYGPGAMYLYLYGMVQGATQDVIGRNDDGTWALTISRGDTKSCWVRTDLLDLNGDIFATQPIHPDDYNLPQSPFYPPLYNVTTQREGSNLTITWSPLILRAGDDSLQTPYVIQAWLCQNGTIVMQSFGIEDQAIITLTDEPGCAEASHGRVTAAEKHGYTDFTEIPWIPAP